MDVTGEYQERVWLSANDILVQMWQFEQDPGESTLFTVFYWTGKKEVVDKNFRI